jgi:hypothetical protein
MPRIHGIRTSDRPHAEAAFIAAGFFAAFQKDLPDNCSWLLPRERQYYDALCRVASRCTLYDLRLLVNIYDGVDCDGSMLSSQAIHGFTAAPQTTSRNPQA